MSIGTHFLYQQANSHFDEAGTATLLNPTTDWQKMDGLLSIRSFFSPLGTFFTELKWSRVTLKQANSETTSYGFSDQLIGYHSNLWSGKNAQLHFQIQTLFPVYQNSDALENKLPFLGDGSFDITAGGFLDSQISDTFELSFGLGFQWRSDDFSTGLPWSTDLHAAFHSLHLGLGLEGYRSLRTDQHAAFLAGSATSAGAGLGSGGLFFY